MLIPSQAKSVSPFEVRLIEVNTNPCIEEPNKLLRQYVPRMLDDMLKIVLDPLFNDGMSTNSKSQVSPPPSHFEVEGVSDFENMWTKIF